MKPIYLTSGAVWSNRPGVPQRHVIPGHDHASASPRIVGGGEEGGGGLPDGRVPVWTTYD